MILQRIRSPLTISMSLQQSLASPGTRWQTALRQDPHHACKAMSIRNMCFLNRPPPQRPGDLRAAPGAACGAGAAAAAAAAGGGSWGKAAPGGGQHPRRCAARIRELCLRRIPLAAGAAPDHARAARRQGVWLPRVFLQICMESHASSSIVQSPSRPMACDRVADSSCMHAKCSQGASSTIAG